MVNSRKYYPPPQDYQQFPVSPISQPVMVAPAQTYAPPVVVVPSVPQKPTKPKKPMEGRTPFRVPLGSKFPLIAVVVTLVLLVLFEGFIFILFNDKNSQSDRNFYIEYAVAMLVWSIVCIFLLLLAKKRPLLLLISLIPTVIFFFTQPFVLLLLLTYIFMYNGMFNNKTFLLVSSILYGIASLFQLVFLIKYVHDSIQMFPILVPFFIFAFGLDNNPTKEYYYYNAKKRPAKTFENPLLEEEPVGFSILASLVTFGIYLVFWIHRLCKKLRLLAGESPACGGEVALILFVPFYSLYWLHTRGKKLHEAANRCGVPLDDNSTLFLLLGVFGLGIVAYALMQNDLNTAAKAFVRAEAAQS